MLCGRLLYVSFEVIFFLPFCFQEGSKLEAPNVKIPQSQSKLAATILVDGKEIPAYKALTQNDAFKFEAIHIHGDRKEDLGTFSRFYKERHFQHIPSFPIKKMNLEVLWSCKYDVFCIRICTLDYEFLC